MALVYTIPDLYGESYPVSLVVTLASLRLVHGAIRLTF